MNLTDETIVSSPSIKNDVAYITSKGKFAHIVVNNKSFTISKTNKLFDQICKQAEKAARIGTTSEKQCLLDLLTPGKYLEIASNGFVEYDKATQRVFIKGTDEVLPVLLGNRIVQAVSEGRSINHLIKFWENCRLNPDPVARNDVYWFLEKEGHPITQDGLFVAYKKVVAKDGATAQTEDQRLSSLITTTDLKEYVIKTINRFKAAELNTKNYGVFLNDSGEFETINTEETVIDSSLDKIGSLSLLADKVNDTSFDDYVKSVANLAKARNSKIYTDSHTGTMRIEPGVPVVLERSKCDSDPHRTCSAGLHVGAMGYVRNFYGTSTLLCLVNPRDVVAVPKDYNGMKMRVCQYIPLVEVSGIIDESLYENEDIINQVGIVNIPTFINEEDDWDDEDDDEDDDLSYDE